MIDSVDGSTGVVVRDSAIEKAWRSGGGNDMWVLLRTGAENAARVSDELQRTNDAMPESVFGEALSPTPTGFAILLTHCAERAEVRRWVDRFTGALSAQGVTGSLGSVTTPRPPPWLGSTLPPVLTAFASYDFDQDRYRDDPRREATWHVPEAATERIVDAANAWARLPDATREMKSNVLRMEIGAEQRPAQVVRALRGTGLAGLRDVVPGQQRATDVAGASPCFVTFQDIGLPWDDTLDRLRDILVGTAADLNWGAVRPAVRLAGDIATITGHQSLAHVDGTDVRYGGQLLDRWAPDAAGLQILRRAHLRRAHDLSRWSVTDLGADRFLVQATDLAPWYEGIVADPDVVARARADFGDLLLTRAVVTEHAID